MGKEKPLVSVIIPSYNSANYLPETIESVLAQKGIRSLYDLEVIVVDDGSTDDTGVVVKKYGERVIYQRIENSGRPAVPRNIGAKMAKGGYLAFLDSDDVWLPNKLKNQIKAFADDKGVVLASSNADKVDSQAKKMNERVVSESLLPKEYSFEQLLKNNFICTSAAVVRRDAFEQAEGFNEDPRLKAVEDYELWLRLAAKGAIAYQGSPTVLYRVHGGNISKANEQLATKRLAMVYKSVARQVERSQKKATLRRLSDIYYSISKMDGAIYRFIHRVAAKVASLRARLLYN